VKKILFVAWCRSFFGLCLAACKACSLQGCRLQDMQPKISADYTAFHQKGFSRRLLRLPTLPFLCSLREFSAEGDC